MLTGEPDALGLSSTRLRHLSAALQAGVDKGEIPGAVMLVGRRGRIVYHEAFGFRDREAGAAMPTDAIFRLASMTKPLVALAAMTLVDKGRLRLDAPIGQFLPALKDMKVAVVADDGSLVLVPARREPMVLDLLRHTSGLTAGHLGNSPVKRLYASAGLSLPTTTRADFLAKLARLPLEFQPGTTFAYGHSIDVLGHIIEEISGIALDEFMRTRITEPLGMPDTGFQLPEACHARIAEPQVDRATGKRPPMRDPLSPPARFSGNGNMVTSARDWARFCQLMLNSGRLDGTRLVSRKTVELMTADQLPPNAGYDPDNAAAWGAALPSPTWGHGFGFGVSVRTHAGRTPWLGSAGDFWWVGAYGTYYWVDPRENLFAILMIQAPAQLVPYVHIARSLVYGAVVD